MAALGNEDELFRNVQNLRIKLQQTEKNLASLQQLEERSDVVSNGSRSSSPGRVPPLTMNDLTPEQPFQGVLSQHSHSEKNSQRDSTKSKHRQRSDARTHVSQKSSNDNGQEKVWKNELLAYQRERNKLLQHDIETHDQEDFVAAKLSSGSNSKLNSHSNSMDYGQGMFDKLREENGQLITQNHKLLNQLEAMGYQLHQANTRANQVIGEAKSYKSQILELEEQISNLEEENKAQDETLRQAEERYEESQTQMEDMHSRMEELHAQQEEMEIECEKYRKELDDVNAELEHEQSLRERTEEERDSALQNIEELQKRIEEIQKKAKDRMKKFHSSEEHLRENLSHADREREELMEANDTLRSQLEVVNKELRELQEKNLGDREMRYNMEQQLNSYRNQMAVLHAEQKKLGEALGVRELLVKENRDLHEKVQQLEKHLASCYQQVADTQAQLLHLEEIAAKMQQERSQNRMETDSGVSMSKARSSTPEPGKQGPPPAVLPEDLDASYLETIHSQESSATRHYAIHQLREQLSHRDAEIEELKHQLSMRLSPKPSASQTIEGLKKELQAVIERNKLGEERVQEQELEINKLQKERSLYLTQITGLEGKLGDLQVQYGSLEARFTQRQTQLADIHKEMTEREALINNLQREVRKRGSKITSLEQQLDSKVSEVTEQVGRATELEEELVTLSCQLEKLRRELDDSRQGSRSTDAMIEKMKQLHSEQCQELEHQLEVVSQKLERKTEQLMGMEGDVQRLNADIDIKDVALAEARRELELSSQQSIMKVRGLEEKTRDAVSQVAHLQSSLHVCQEELRVNLQRLEENRELAEREHLEHEEMVAELQAELKKTQELCDEKESQFLTMEATLEEKQQMLLESAETVVRLEDIQTILETQVNQLEQTLERQKLDWGRQISEMENTLRQTGSELQQRLQQVNDLTNTIREMTNEKKRLGEEILSLKKKHNKEKKDSEEKDKSIAELEMKLRDMHNQLHDKSEQIEDLEEQLRSLEYDVEERGDRVNKLDSKLKDTQGEVHAAGRKIQELKDDLNQALKDSSRKQETLESLKHQLRCSQDELRSRNRELEEAEQLVKQRQFELVQRSAQISDIEQLVRERQTELEKQVTSMEASLKKAQQELKAKEKTVSELESQVAWLEGEVKEKTQQLQQARQTLAEHQREVDNLTNTHRLSDREIQKLHTQLEDTIEENRDLLLQLNKCREEKGQAQHELQETTRELALCQREQERLSRELQDYTANAKVKEEQLAEALSGTKSREQELERTMEKEIKQLQWETESLLTKHKNELIEMEQKHRKSLENQEAQNEQQATWLAQAKDREARLLRELEIAHEEIANLQKEVLRLEGDLEKLEHNLQYKQLLLTEARQHLMVKESEMTQLEGRVVCQESSTSDSHTNLRMSERMSALRDRAVYQSTPNILTTEEDDDSPSQVLTSTPTKQKSPSQLRADFDSSSTDTSMASTVSRTGTMVSDVEANKELYFPGEWNVEAKIDFDSERERTLFHSEEAKDPDSLVAMWKTLQQESSAVHTDTVTESPLHTDSTLSDQGNKSSKIPTQCKGARPKVKSKQPDVFTRLSQPTDKTAKTLQKSNTNSHNSKTVPRTNVKLVKPVVGKVSSSQHGTAAEPSSERKSIQSQYELMFGGTPAPEITASSSGASAIQALGQQLLKEMSNWKN